MCIYAFRSGGVLPSKQSGGGKRSKSTYRKEIEHCKRSNHSNKRIYVPSSSPKLESSPVATFIPFPLARERQFAISARLLSATRVAVSFSAEWMTGNRLKLAAESGVFIVELEFVEKERRLRGV